MMRRLNSEEQDRPHTGWIAWLIQLAVGLLLVGVILLLSDIPSDYADRVRAIDDIFTVVALLYLCIGALLWVSTTGFFDIFGFAVKRALHAFVPGMIKDTAGDYYEYREGRRLKRRRRSLSSTFFAGLFLLFVSIGLTLWWYRIGA